MKPLTMQTLVYLIVMVGVIIGSDLLFFRNDAILRFGANIVIVAAFFAAYFFIFKQFK